jgi:L-asparagine transporter-like permease
MGTPTTKKLFIFWHTLLMLVAGWSIGPVIATWMPEHYFEWYPFIPVFFYIFGWFTIYMFEACRRDAPHQIQWVYMGSKAIRLFFSLGILLIYAVKVEEKKTEFFLTFAGFYLLNMMFESWFFYRYERINKTEK